jgi:hypothetical protein
LKSHFLKPLAYFDIFDHPLQREELKQLCLNSKELDIDLKLALAEGKCFEKEDYYSISPDIKTLVKNRLEKEERAKKYIQKLSNYSKLISRFPFVKGLAISGSLSKNVMHDDGDIDYFIITKRNRLWLCRTLLILYKKIFLLNSRKYFCVNYFVDEDNLEIRDKNIFTAIELTYLLPVYNQDTYEQLMSNNKWVLKHFKPINHPISFKTIEKKTKKNHWIESLLGNSLGERLDLFFMGVTINRWKKKFSHFDAEKMELTMRSNRGISKHHPSDFQNKVLSEYAKRLKKLKIKDEGIIHA